MCIYSGKVYKVFIKFDKKLLNTSDKIEKFIKKEFPNIILDDKEIEDFGVKLISLEGNRLELLWNVPDEEGIHEIEISLYYILGNDEYGSYSCEYVR